MSPVVTQSVNPIQYIPSRFSDWKKLARKDFNEDRTTVSILMHIQRRGGKLGATWRTLVEREPQNQRFLNELAIDLLKDTNADDADEAIQIWRTVLDVTPSIQQLRQLCMDPLDKSPASLLGLFVNKDYLSALHAAEPHLAVWQQLHTKHNRMVQDYIFPMSHRFARGWNSKFVRFPLSESTRPKEDDNDRQRYPLLTEKEETK